MAEKSITSEKSTRTSDGKKAHITNKGIEYYDKKLKNQKVTEEFKLYDNEIASEFVSGYWGVDQSQYKSSLVANADKGFREMVFDRTEENDDGSTTDIYVPPAALFKNDYNEMLENNDGQEVHSETSDFTRTVNPDWGVENGTIHNCAKCTATTALQWKGVKNAVAGRQHWPTYSDAMENWFDSPERKDYHYDEDPFEDIKSYGTGAFGTMNGAYPKEKGGGGHIFNWFNEKDGSVSIVDGQSGSRFTANSYDDVIEHYGFADNTVKRTYRLDNADPNWDALMNDSVLSTRSLPNFNNRTYIYNIVNNKKWRHHGSMEDFDKDSFE